MHPEGGFITLGLQMFPRFRYFFSNCMICKRDGSYFLGALYMPFFIAAEVESIRKVTTPPHPQAPLQICMARRQ
jgi:hypothetical protein